MRDCLLFMLLASALLAGPVSALAGSEPAGFKNYDQCLDQIRDKYNDPWIGFLETHKDYGLPGVRFFQVCEREHLNEDPVTSYIWIITANGHVFAGRDITAALEDAGHFPEDGKAAIKTAAAIAAFTWSDSDVIRSEWDFEQYVPVEFRSLSRFPEVEETNGRYVVTLYVSHYLPGRTFGITPTWWELRKHTITIDHAGYSAERGAALANVQLPSVE